MLLFYFSYYLIMSDPYLSLVPVQNQLGVDIKRNEVKRKIIERVTELGLNNIHYKFNQELLLLVCNLAEFLIVKKDKVDKLAIVLDVFDTLFGISVQDKAIFESNINFLHQSKMIKTVSRWKLFCTGIKELFFKKK